MFTEHGAVMLASVLNSPQAVQASILVVDAFVRLRRIIDANRSLARRIDELAEKVDFHDRTIAVIFNDLQRLVSGEGEPETEQPSERIGFKTNKERGISGKGRELRGRRTNYDE